MAQRGRLVSELIEDDAAEAARLRNDLTPRSRAEIQTAQRRALPHCGRT
jgi:hypothetical protein